VIDHQDTLKLHWSSSKPNFGDALSPLICEKLAGKKIVHADIAHCDLVALGSLMQRVKNGFFRKKIHVWGSGFIESGPKVKSKHHYHALRGRLTLGRLKSPANDIVLGDPGLLADILIADRPIEKKYQLGVVCHYKDKADSRLQMLSKHDGVKEIDIFLPPEKFLSELMECEFIASSAMHGLIAADALGIPNQWLKLSDKIRGGGFKFRDYYSVFDMDPEPRMLEDVLDTFVRNELAVGYQRPNIGEIKKNLVLSFPCLDDGARDQYLSKL